MRLKNSIENQAQELKKNKPDTENLATSSMKSIGIFAPPSMKKIASEMKQIVIKSYEDSVDIYFTSNEFAQYYQSSLSTHLYDNFFSVSCKDMIVVRKLVPSFYGICRFLRFLDDNFPGHPAPVECNVKPIRYVDVEKNSLEIERELLSWGPAPKL